MVIISDNRVKTTFLTFVVLNNRLKVSQQILHQSCNIGRLSSVKWLAEFEHLGQHTPTNSET